VWVNAVFPGEVNTYRKCKQNFPRGGKFTQISKNGPSLECYGEEIYVVKVRMWTRGFPKVLRGESQEVECDAEKGAEVIEYFVGNFGPSGFP
jgi:hypothetical protein